MVKVYGLHAATAAMRDPTRVETVHVVSGKLEARLTALVESATAAGLQVVTVPRETLDGLAGGGRHQGIVLDCRPAQALPESALRDLLQAGDGPLVLLVLDGVTDPHNLGACLRTADAAGVDAVVAPRDRAVGLTPAARKVASGAAETIPFIQVTNLARALRGMRELGVWVLGAEEEAEESLYDMELPPRAALVMGAENNGLRRLTRENCDQLVRIPMQGGVSSLNVSVAAGICLFEIVRRRGLR